jgi:hypothetical protein
MVRFDMDYTLAIYHQRRIEQLSFDLALPPGRVQLSPSWGSSNTPRLRDAGIGWTGSTAT